jgi:RHH-type proline utilization regulon transcriptional repressor/proline dehydrogenase/delta 1-pyrroline-5-carboxylate dehydrogenase
LAARIARCRATVSIPRNRADRLVELLHDLTEPWAARIEFLEESDEDLVAAIRGGSVERIRYADVGRVPEQVWIAAAATGVHISTSPVLGVGRLELLHYMREQSLCLDYHRYGNLGARADEERTPVE